MYFVPGTDSLAGRARGLVPRIALLVVSMTWISILGWRTELVIVVLGSLVSKRWLRGRRGMKLVIALEELEYL